MNVAALYLVGVLLLTFYGIEVCPFLETLPPVELGAVIGAAFLIALVLRYLLFRGMAGDGDGVDIQRPWRCLRLDLALWILAGLLVTGWNFAHYDFPIESGLKVVLGCATLGIFSSTCLALDQERRLILRLAERDLVEGLARGRFLSITTKFLVFIGASLVLIAGVILLLVYKDFQFVIDALETGRHFRLYWVINEVLFVFGVLLAGSLTTAWYYTRNLRLIFDLQRRTFEAVDRGNYRRFMPVVSHDELGLIAEGVNRMIEGLREKQRIREAFGKYLSRPVAEVILQSEEETGLGGRQVDVAVLFTDIRDFTAIAERSAPQEVVALLNRYFTTVVEAVHRHRGIVDKFIGDAAMAVFGLDGGETPCDDALNAAVNIREGIEALNRELAARGGLSVDGGIGIHYGPVVAGNIGSEERLEYTVIGDTVNTASRLEGLTKDLGTAVLVSAEVYSRAGAAIKPRLTYLGSHPLKGKTAPHPVYGLALGVPEKAPRDQ